MRFDDEPSTLLEDLKKADPMMLVEMALFLVAVLAPALLFFL